MPTGSSEAHTTSSMVLICCTPPPIATGVASVTSRATRAVQRGRTSFMPTSSRAQAISSHSHCSRPAIATPIEAA